MKIRLMLTLLSLFVLFLTSCDSEKVEHHFHHSLMEKLEGATAANNNGGVSTLPHLEGIEWEKVEGFEDRPKFFVEKRDGQLNKSPCSSCHNKPLKEMVTKGAQRKAHWDIQLQHAGPKTMGCSTCHASDKNASLSTLNGQTVSVNQSYKVCIQCHFQQGKDWSGGAHGKRLGGWSTPRVVKNCASCHNPHKPGFEKRWPVRASSLPQNSIE